MNQEGGCHRGRAPHPGGAVNVDATMGREMLLDEAHPASEIADRRGVIVDGWQPQIVIKVDASARIVGFISHIDDRRDAPLPHLRQAAWLVLSTDVEPRDDLAGGGS